MAYHLRHNSLHNNTAPACRRATYMYVYRASCPPVSSQESIHVFEVQMACSVPRALLLAGRIGTLIISSTYVEDILPVIDH